MTSLVIILASSLTTHCGCAKKGTVRPYQEANTLFLVQSFKLKDKVYIYIENWIFLLLRFRQFKYKVKDYILLDESQLNGCIESYFCFNFQQNLFIIFGDNLHFKQKGELVEKTLTKRECVRKKIMKQSYFIERKIFLCESVIIFEILLR